MEEQKRPYVKTFSCPNCAGSVSIRAIGSSINVVCSYCSSIIDTNDENYKVVDTFTNKLKRRQVIGLGQRGELFGTLWEIIGYMERVEQSGTYFWSEYLLFNPLKGFRWLTEYAGHWSFTTTIKDNPELHPLDGTASGSNLVVPEYAWHKNKKYSIFSNGTARVNFVIGEFYWQVRVGETVNIQEFIAPPEILTLEKTSEERVWSLGLYVSADTIKNAFQVESPMPFQTGVAPNQPSPLGEEGIAKIKKYWKYFSYAVLLIQIGFCLGTKREVVYSGQIEFTPYDTQKTKVTPQFEIKDATTTLDINFSSPVNNNWLEIGADLVNDDNGETEEFEQGIEYYSGTDSDGAWSEGSTSATETIPSVSKGKYHLNLEVTGPALTKPTDPLANSIPTSPVTLNVEVKTGALLWSNFFFALFLVSIYPIFIIWKRRKFEVARWSESDYSPYNSYDSDDEDDSE
jgi:hypothetical protein